METGVLPRHGGLQMQSEAFCECFYFFVDRYRTRHYQRMWRDGGELAGKVLEGMGKMFSKIFRG